MVRFTLIRAPLPAAAADAVALGVAQGVDWKKRTSQELDRAFAGIPSSVMALGDFRAKFKEVRVSITRGALPSPRLMLLGLGSPVDLNLDGIREIGARIALVARDYRLARVAFALPPVVRARPAEVAEAFAEGVVLGLFEYREFKSSNGDEDRPRVALEEVLLCETRSDRWAALKEGIERGVVLAETTNLARTLIMRPSLHKSPEAIARVAQAEAKKHGVAAQVLRVPQLRRLGMGGLLGVGQGSERPPCMVVLRYRGAGRRRVVLCGKGIVFDSGGINIKPSEGMEKMKYDMSGSAAVLGAVLAAARLRLPLEVTGILALAENMPSGSAIRPGDVLRAYNDKTIEVGNTDAEGRLVLADAVSYGVDKFKPDFLVDVATLTGAVRIALGNITLGVMGNDAGLIEDLRAAGQRTGDDLWELPLNKLYEKQVQSDIADVKNVGIAGSAGAIAGAAFIKQFVGSTKWAHLDIAGTAWTEKGPADLNKDYLPKGPTGIGVRLLAEWMRAVAS